MTREVKPIRETARERFAKWAKEVGVCKLAKILDVDPGHVSRLKNGKRGVSGELAAKIQKLRGIPAADWFEVS